MKKELEIPEEVEVKKEGSSLVLNGEKGELEKEVNHPRVDISVGDGKVIFNTAKENRKSKRILNSLVSRVKNMIKGVEQEFTYEMKVCYSHFPISVDTTENKVLIKNFIGEDVPREAKILEGVEVKVDDQDLKVSGMDLDNVSQTAANIEQATRITGKDERIFQDGIYITKKDN